MLRFALPAALAFGALLAPAALTQPAAPRLELPLACPGGRCVVQQYFDHDSGPAARDHRCGAKAYDDHDGTDFRVPTRAAMLAGVAVRAAAAGTVKNIRDGVADHTGTEADIRGAQGRECGNGVVLAHPGGWETQYCHMKNGSVRVREGQSVAAGVPLGQVGQTGETAFPHLHLGVRENGREVDPFSYGARPLSCGAGGRSLWSPAAAAAIPYRAPEVLNAGFAIDPVTMPEIENAATGPAPTAASPALLAFVRAIGLDAGDVQTLTVTGPGGFKAEQTTAPLERPRAQHMLFAGKRNTAGRWPSGAYQARYTVRRRGEVVLDHKFQHAL